MDGAAVEAVLQLYPDRFRSRGCSLPADGPGFSGAVVRRVETGVGPHCLRGWPAEANPERIGGLHRLLSHVRARGIEFVAVPVPANDGRTLVSAGGRWWQLEPWLPGRADFSSRPTDTRLIATLTSLARLHLAMAQFEPAGADKKWFRSSPSAIAPAVSERFERLESWTRARLAELETRIESTPTTEGRWRAAAASIARGFTRCAPRIAHELRAALRMRVALQPCLRDVWHDHILFDGDRVSGIIDPAAARSDTVAADVSRLLGSLLADEDRAWDAALATYQSVRHLSLDEMTLVGVLDRSGTLLSGMTWLFRRFFSNRPLENPERVVARMEKIAKRIERLAP